jgi:hypothetical protein
VIEQLLADVINDLGVAVAPFGEISKVGFVTIRVILLVELGLDKHSGRPFFDAKFNLDHVYQLIY